MAEMMVYLMVGRKADKKVAMMALMKAEMMAWIRALMMV